MKKFLVFFLVMSLAVSFVTAEDEGIGLSVGLEFGFENIGDEERVPYLMPLLVYEKSFFDDALDLFAEIEYTIGFVGEGELEQSLALDFMAGYNLKLGDANTLSLIFQNEFDEMVISPGFSLDGIFTPAVKFTREFDFGDIFAQIGAPIYYFNYADPEFGLDFTLGWGSTFGLKIEAKLLTLLVPSDDAGYNGFEALVSYENGPVYFEVEMEIPREISEEGVIITPEFEYSFGRWSLFVNCEFADIGVGSGASFSPGLGVKFTF